MVRGYLAANKAATARLAEVVARLSAQDLSVDLGGGWNVAVALAHVAFWEQRALVLLQRWAAHGVGPSPVDGEALNEALLPFWAQFPPAQAGPMAVAAAQAVDQALEALTPEAEAAIKELEGQFNLARWQHREEHTAQVEWAVANAHMRGLEMMSRLVGGPDLVTGPVGSADS